MYLHHNAPAAIAKEKGFSSLNTDSGFFDQQIGYLASHGNNSIFASSLMAALHSHTPLPSKSIVISIDDGYQDVYDYAFPTEKKYNMKISLFVPTGLIGVHAGSNSYFSLAELKDMVNSGIAEAKNHTFSHAEMGSKGPAEVNCPTRDT